MTDLTTILPGQMLWDHGTDVYGSARDGGMVVRVEANADGETEVVLITTDRGEGKNLRPTLIVHHQDGRKGTRRPAYEDIGPVARLVRMPVSSVDHKAADNFRSPSKVLDHARAALFAAAVALLPDYLDRHAHDQFLTAYRVLRAEADSLQRGIA